MNNIQIEEGQALVRKFFELLDTPGNMDLFKPYLTTDFEMGFKAGPFFTISSHDKIKKSEYIDESHQLVSIDDIYALPNLAFIKTTMIWKAKKIAKDNKPEQNVHVEIHHSWFVERDIVSGKLRLAAQFLDTYSYFKDSCTQTHLEELRKK